MDHYDTSEYLKDACQTIARLALALPMLVTRCSDDSLEKRFVSVLVARLRLMYVYSTR